MKNILITGASGLVGSRLSEILLQQGYNVGHLVRNKSTNPTTSIKQFYWNIQKKTIDIEAIEFADVIIHLAGAGVMDGRWTAKRKREILQSRVESSKLLFETLKNNKNHVQVFVSASAIGIYGADTGYELMHEQSPHGTNFLAKVVEEWENESLRITEIDIRTIALRIGIVLSNEGGALTKMAEPVKYWIGSPLGSGDQVVSWIHIDDLCGIFIHAFENIEMNGVYNAVAPTPVANTELIQTIARKLHKPLFMPKIPSFVLKFILGEMAEVVLGGNKVSARKIIKTGYKFKYPELSLALKNLLTPRKLNHQ